MKKTAPLRVALIFGGRGHERLISEKSAEYIFSSTDRARISPIPIRIAEDGRWLASLGCGTSLGECVFDTEVYPAFAEGHHGFAHSDGFIDIDCAIPALHGDFGEDGRVQGALECAGIHYVGCDVICGAVCSDKSYTKSVAEHLGIPVARWICISPSDTNACIAEKAEKYIGYPSFVKPARLGSSIGASRADDCSSLIRAVSDARALSGRVMIEECVDIGAELECAYLGVCGEDRFSEVGMIECHGTYDYESKYLTSSATVSDRCDIPSNTRRLILDYSAMLRDELDVRHLARFDFFLTRDGGVIFNEINTFPGFTASSLYPRLVARMGIPPSELITTLVREAAEA